MMIRFILLAVNAFLIWSKNVKVQMASSDREINLMLNAAFTLPEKRRPFPTN